MNTINEYEKTAAYLKQFDCDVIGYEFAETNVTHYGIKVGAEFRKISGSQRLCAKLEGLEKWGSHWRDEKTKFTFPIDEIPKVIAELEKIYLIANKSDHEG